MTAIDDFAGQIPQLPDWPAENAALVSPSDSTDLAHATRGICMDADGALQVTMVGGQTVTYTSGMLAPGIIHPIRATRIFATGTGGQNIMAHW